MMRVRYNNEVYNLTAREADILTYVYQRWTTGRPSPSARNVAEALRGTHDVSISSIGRDIHNLARLGLLVRTFESVGVGITSDGMQIAQRVLKAFSAP